MIESKLTYDMYERCLAEQSKIEQNMNMIRSDAHNLYTVNVTKTCLSAFDDKKYLLEDGISSLAFGHKDIYLFARADLM